MTDPSSEGSLTPEVVEGVRRRDPDAIVSLYKALSSPLYAYLLRQTRNPSSAEDLTADVFLEVLTGADRFVGTPERMRAWVFRIARNTLIDHVRKETRRKHESLETTPEAADAIEFQIDPESEALARIERDRLVALVGELPPDQRDVVLLRLVADLPIADVAYMLERSVGAVKALQHRALRRLAKMAGLLPFGEDMRLELVSPAGAAGITAARDSGPRPYPSEVLER